MSPSRRDCFLLAGIIIFVASFPLTVTAQLNSTNYFFRGCFYDDADYDVLPDLIDCSNFDDVCLNECSQDRPYCQSYFMTVDLCDQICTNQNARYFGLQDGSQCLCGGAYANYDIKGAPSAMDSCNKNCTGNSSQICGGSFTIFLFEITETKSDCFHPGYITVGTETFPPPEQGVFQVNDTLEYNDICQSPSVLNGDSSITCTENGNWSGAPPLCDIRCSQPEPAPYVFFGQSQEDSFGIGETVTYMCTVNTSIIFTAVCNEWGLWDFLIDCPVTCTVSELPVGGALDSGSPMRQHYEEGALVTFVCDGATLSNTLTCGQSGDWHPSTVHCPEIALTTSTLLTTSVTEIGPHVDDSITTSFSTMSSMTTDPMGGPMSGSSREDPRFRPTPDGQTGDGPAVWIIPVAVVIPVVVILIVLIVCCCWYRKKRRDEEDKRVPQVVLGYMKKTGTFGGRNHDMEADLGGNPEGEPENHSPKKSNTLSHSLNTMKQQFVKRVTLSRSRPELPPKKNPKKSTIRSQRDGVRDGPGDSGIINAFAESPKPPPSAFRKKASEISMVPVFAGNFEEDEVEEETKDIEFTGGPDDSRISRSSQMLDELMVEFEGRVNFAFDETETSARSTPSVATSKDSPAPQRVIVHSPGLPLNVAKSDDKSPGVNGVETEGLPDSKIKPNGTIGDSNGGLKPPSSMGIDFELTNGDITSPYATLGHPKPAPIKVAADTESSLNETLNDDHRPESPGYASLGEAMTSSNSEQSENSSVNGTGPETPKYEVSKGKRPPPLTLDLNGEAPYMNSRGSLTGTDSSHYATLGGARPKMDENQNGGVGVTSPRSPATPPLHHGYVNVGRSSTPRNLQEFSHPSPPPLPPPDSP